MNGFARAVLAGAFGSIATNLLHEFFRRSTPQAPRVDLLGMQALTRSADALDAPAPNGRDLYLTTLAGDLVSNAAYFALAALVPQRYAVAGGAALGLIAGVGAVRLPEPLGLSAITTNRTPLTRGLTVALYGIGGVVAGLLLAGDDGAAADERFFAGKHVVISGGTRGLGFVLAQQLLAAGASVTIGGRSAETLNAALAKLGAGGKAVMGLPGDVRERAHCDRLISWSVERNGPIDVLINNAGVIEVGPIELQTVDDYREAMETHFWAPFYLTSAVLPAMRKRGSGSIANIASIGGLVGVPHLAPYSASKFAQVGFTQALAAEAAAAGISVTSVTPGLMITGSPDHAIFKGRNQAEYAWFTLADASPLVAVPVDAAAARIMRGIRRGEAQVTIGWTAKAAKTVNVLFPQTTARLLALTARLLPPAGGIGSARQAGAQSRSRWTQNPLTFLNSVAVRRANQQPVSNDNGTAADKSSS